MLDQQRKQHISYSEIKDWEFCPFYHKLTRVDKIAGFEGNEYTAFGTAIHSVCEAAVQSEYWKVSEHDTESLTKYFEETFLNELSTLKEKKIPLREKIVLPMRDEAKKIIPHIIPALTEYFGKDLELMSFEEEIYELVEKELSKKDINFKAYIDLVVKTPDGKYHIVDWKTCSWGWDSRKKADPMVVYQLTYYKHFFAQKHNIDPDLIETHFALLKRTASKKNVEFFKVSNGKKRTKNALNLMKKAVHNINNCNHPKNRLSCTRGYGCQFYKTEHCP
jgi:ATP-dependent exoDNAse (exonuclease V) beta subunit